MEAHGRERLKTEAAADLERRRLRLRELLWREREGLAAELRGLRSGGEAELEEKRQRSQELRSAREEQRKQVCLPWGGWGASLVGQPPRWATGPEWHSFPSWAWLAGGGRSSLRLLEEEQREAPRGGKPSGWGPLPLAGVGGGAAERKGPTEKRVGAHQGHTVMRCFC